MDGGKDVGMAHTAPGLAQKRVANERRNRRLASRTYGRAISRRPAHRARSSDLTIRATIRHCATACCALSFHARVYSAWPERCEPGSNACSILR